MDMLTDGRANHLIHQFIRTFTNQAIDSKRIYMYEQF